MSNAYIRMPSYSLRIDRYTALLKRSRPPTATRTNNNYTEDKIWPLEAVAKAWE